MFVIRRHPENPLLAPRREQSWQGVGTFNPSVVKTEKGLRMYYRALAHPPTVIAPFSPESTIGMVESEDGVHFSRERQVLVPKQEWEAFGCEDPRATVFGDTTYLAYTAIGGYPYGPGNIKAAMAVSKDGEHFDERHLMTPFNAKAFALFPDKVSGKFAALLTAHTDFTPEHPRPTIGIALADSIEEFWKESFWHDWHDHLSEHALDIPRRSDEDHVEVGAPPILTERGWLLVYSYVQHYYDPARRIFGIEAVLLEKENPRRVIGRTYPFIVPEEVYERYGLIPNVTFPTSALVNDDGTLDIYYGAADTSCAKASVRLADLLDSMDAQMPVFKRCTGNPILLPQKENPFEEKLVFNPAAIDLGGSVHILYRAMDMKNTSTVGYARSENGLTIDERLTMPAYVPREAFEQKLGKPDGNSGCEDPRAVVIDGRVYMTYTAYDGVHAPAGAVTSIPTKDFLAKNWSAWEKPFIVTPDETDDKDLALLPEKVQGQDGSSSFLLYHRIGGRICAEMLTSLAPGTKMTRCIEIMGPREGMWDAAKVGVAGPPLRVPGGFLMLYHGVSRRSKYRVGAVLLANDGVTILARAADPIFEPIEPYETTGEIPNVVFPCGAVIREDTVFLYYGGADTVVGVATASLSRILASLS